MTRIRFDEIDTSLTYAAVYESVSEDEAKIILETEDPISKFFNTSNF